MSRNRGRRSEGLAVKGIVLSVVGSPVMAVTAPVALFPIPVYSIFSSLSLVRFPTLSRPLPMLLSIIFSVISASIRHGPSRTITRASLPKEEFLSGGNQRSGTLEILPEFGEFRISPRHPIRVYNANKRLHYLFDYRSVSVLFRTFSYGSSEKPERPRRSHLQLLNPDFRGISPILSARLG